MFVMAIAAHETREDKLKWLMRPFNWASDLGLVLLVTCGGALYNSDTISPSHLCLVLLIGIGVIMGLLTFGIARMSNAARGRI
jgi:hypothetical protein